jgi:hypothetical protein
MSDEMWKQDELAGIRKKTGMTSFKVGPKISAFFLMGLRNTTDYLNQLI